MISLRVFDNHSDYDYFAEHELVNLNKRHHNVSLCRSDYTTHFNPKHKGATVFSVEGGSNVVSETSQYVALADGRAITPDTWSVISGGTYATIDSGGTLTVGSTANNSSVTIQATYGDLTATKELTVTYKSGSTAETTTETVVDSSGHTTTTTTTVTENSDGTTTTQSTSIVYDTNGEPIEKTNEGTDSSGNITVQEIEYGENGEEIVVSYDIDTSGSQSGSKNFNGDGINTEYYAFDMTHGFVLDLDFTIDFAHQPTEPDAGGNHHHVLTAKRADPSPWYGFQIRHSNSNKYVQLGTQFSTGSNTNTTISPQSLTGNIATYSLTITYDPLAGSNTFVCYDNIAGSSVYTSNGVFPDLEELRYLKVMLGYAVKPDETPYRYSNINVSNFSIRRLSYVETPTITCDGMSVSISCGTAGTTIYYRLNQVGVYSAYTTPIVITADTVVQAYAMLGDEKSKVAFHNCIFDNGVDAPRIYCDGEMVSIDCDTPSVDIYYRFNQSGNFSAYTESFAITATTVVEAYSYLNGLSSSTVSETCTYSPIVLVAPVISCNGDTVTITCETPNASIYYNVDGGSYASYTTSFTITADTVVQAYSSYRGNISSVVTQNCIYNPIHDYSQDYLTFRVISNGTIAWKAYGSGYNKAIQYSINNGSWTSITASSTPATISVSANDVVRFKGTNTTYAGSKSNYAGFDGGTAYFDIEGNILSLIYGDDFVGKTTFSGGTYNFCSIFKQSNVISAENLILLPTTLTNYCYRAMFSYCVSLTTPPQLPATTLAQGCYWYMFEACAITEAPELPATTLVKECYGNMFNACTNLNNIKCMATNVASPPTSALTNWVINVAATGTFIKDGNTTWSRGNSGVPNGWTIFDDADVSAPVIAYDGFDEITITCATAGANIFYKLNQDTGFTNYTTAITITADTIVHAYSEFGGQTSMTVSQQCAYVSDVPLEASNRNLEYWTYGGQSITTPYSINAIDGHSSSYSKGTFNLETSFALRSAQPAYLWFQHADQTADIYVDNVKVETHWGGYTSFFSDISNYVHSGTNNIKVALCNTTRNTIAPAAGDFNFNATLGNVKLLTSPYLPSMSYGYDGFHVTSNVSSASATINVKTTIPTGATVVCTISGTNCNYTATSASTASEMTFTTTITNPHLWNGTVDPYLYNITLEIYHGSDLYHRFQRPYGLRYYEYVINDTVKYGTAGNPYTGFLLNGSPYLLRGVCMHDDLAEKANALNASDYTQEFNIIQELGCNFIRLAHYPHPKEVYDWCDQLGIVVQTEAPCVNKLQSTMPADYYTHLEGQYTDMVNQHYNHPCILFWGLSNETTTDDQSFGKTKIEGYTSLIKSLDTERMVGYVMSHSYNDPYGYYGSPSGIDWVGGNIYVGWYIDKATNDPTSQINTRIDKTITKKGMALAFSEYGCGGTQRCHSDDPQTTTTKGNYERHDIEYQMWLHEGHIASIKNFPQLLFTGQWQLFDIAVANRNEGYTICLDGVNTSVDDDLRRLNNKGLVERDHVTKKDTFYLYKAWWNPTPFVHICGKEYTKTADRVIKCYTNGTGTFTLYKNNVSVATATATNNILEFTAQNFSSGDVIRVDGTGISDTFTFS